MGKYPKIKLKIDIERDINNCINFIKCERSGVRRQFLLWFLPVDFQYILSKNFSEKERNKIIREYTKHIYKIRKDEIEKGLKNAKKDWQKVEKRYFQLVDKIFKGHPWPEGNYRGIISIWQMYPRYIQHKIFFFPYKHKIAKFSNKVIAHEMLHFIFFDYLEKKYKLKEKSKIPGKSDEYVWQVSEVFNNVIEAWGPYNKLFKEKPRPYPGTEKIFQKMKRQWGKKQDIDWLLDQWFRSRFN
jgi:hypothetical protein